MPHRVRILPVSIFARALDHCRNTLLCADNIKHHSIYMELDIRGYTLLRTLGKGGMATVYLARQKLLERNVALKVMAKSLAEDQAFGQRFLREARICSQLIHPNIVTVYEVGQHKDHYYLSMEYIDGHDLRVARRRLSIVECLRVIEDIARALHYAGDKGYVHRDIKPENIMFRRSDGSAVLTDFGIARAVEADLSVTQTGIAIGTPHYMSPEQAKGKAVDRRSDLYSLGVVFYWMLVGQVPYDADTAVAIGIKHITEPLPQLPPALSPLQGVLDGLLAKDPENRYQDGLSLLNDLRRVDIRSLTGLELGYVDSPMRHTTLSTSVDGASGAPNDTSRFTLEFEAVPIKDEQPRSILPGFFALTFIVVATVSILYVARPRILEPVFDKADSYAAPLYASSLARLELFYRTVLTRLGIVDDGLTDAPGTVKKQHNPGVARVSSPGSASKPAANTPVKSANKSRRPLAEYQADIAALGASSNADPSLMSALVNAQRALLEAYPETEPTASEYRERRQSLRAEIINLASAGELERSNELFQRYRILYDEDRQSKRDINALRAEIDERIRINQLFTLADMQRDALKIMSPEGDNALESYRQILATDATNARALRELEKLLSPLREIARKALNRNDFDEASAAVQAALSIAPGQVDLLQLKGIIEQQQSVERRIANLMRQAERHVAGSYLFVPEGASAYDQYQAILQLDPNYDAAREGQKQLIDKLSERVWALVAEAKFDQALTLLERPLALMPRNRRLLSLRDQVQDASQSY